MLQKVTQKKNKPKGKKKIAKHVDFIKELWNDEKTVKSNFDKLGLALNPNESISVKNIDIDESQIEKAAAEAEEMKDNLEVCCFNSNV